MKNKKTILGLLIIVICIETLLHSMNSISNSLNLVQQTISQLTNNIKSSNPLQRTTTQNLNPQKQMFVTLAFYPSYSNELNGSGWSLHSTILATVDSDLVDQVKQQLEKLPKNTSIYLHMSNITQITNSSGDSGLYAVVNLTEERKEQPLLTQFPFLNWVWVAISPNKVPVNLKNKTIDILLKEIKLSDEKQTFFHLLLK